MMTIDFISANIYASIYFYVMLFVVLFTILHSFTLDIDDRKNLSYIRNMNFFVLFFSIFYIGLRPINEVFVDMVSYAAFFNMTKQGSQFIPITGDVLFDAYSFLCSKIMNVQSYFLLCAIIYIVPLYIVSKKWFGEYAFYAFLALIISFSFWAYGTNGIRNGLSTSLFILAISRDKRLFQILWIIVAIGFHKSILLPTICFIVAQLYHKPNKILMFWVLCILLSVSLGHFWENLFSNLNIDDRISYLANEGNSSIVTATKFRWDFLLYSSIGAFAGWYYINKLHFQDKIYNWLYTMYLLSNAFWILIIRASYSNRFAYLSWFILALIVIYPLLKENLVNNQQVKIGFVLLAYFSFTFIMNVIIY